MACARPVVAVGAGGVPEIIRHGIDGLLVPVGDASSMAEAPVLRLRDEALATRLGGLGADTSLHGLHARASRQPR